MTLASVATEVTVGPIHFWNSAQLCSNARKIDWLKKSRKLEKPQLEVLLYFVSMIK